MVTLNPQQATVPKEKNLVRRLRNLLLAGLAPTPVTTGVHAQGGGVLEEVMVSATRRVDSNIMTTPVAITAITNSDIEAYSPRDLNDIAVMVPSLSAVTVSALLRSGVWC
jgi:outer membrane cobalamin receptor